MGLNQEKKISFHRILIPLYLTRVCVSIFKPQVGFLDVRKCFTDYCTALSIVTTCQKNSGQKILDILSWEPIYLGHLVPQSFPHRKKIFWGSSCLHSSRYRHQKIHINVLTLWVYISDISYHQIHMLYHFMKKKIFVNHNLHIKTNSFLQCSSHLFGKLTQVMKRSLNHKKKKTWELSSNIW